MLNKILTGLLYATIFLLIPYPGINLADATGHNTARPDTHHQTSRQVTQWCFGIPSDHVVQVVCSDSQIACQAQRSHLSVADALIASECSLRTPAP
jgi:hypothetical protein